MQDYESGALLERRDVIMEDVTAEAGQGSSGAAHNPAHPDGQDNDSSLGGGNMDGDDDDNPTSPVYDSQNEDEGPTSSDDSDDGSEDHVDDGSGPKSVFSGGDGGSGGPPGPRRSSRTAKPRVAFWHTQDPKAYQAAG